MNGLYQATTSVEFSCKAATQGGRRVTSYRQLRVKDSSKVPRWRLEVESNQRSSAPKAPNTWMGTDPHGSANQAPN